jgi:hypothetical protein
MGFADQIPASRRRGSQFRVVLDQPITLAVGADIDRTFDVQLDRNTVRDQPVIVSFFVASAVDLVLQVTMNDLSFTRNYSPGAGWDWIAAERQLRRLPKRTCMWTRLEPAQAVPIPPGVDRHCLPRVVRRVARHPSGGLLRTSDHAQIGRPAVDHPCNDAEALALLDARTPTTRPLWRPRPADATAGS